MNDWLQRIAPGRRISLNIKAIGRMGLREVVLLGSAVVQAIWLIFMMGSLAFEVRFVLALLIATALVCLASVPIRGMTAERALLKFARGLLGPKRYRHQTARTDDVAEATSDTDTAAPPKRRKPTPAVAAGDASAWDAPNLGLVVFVFMCLVTLSSLITYAARGSIPGLS